MSQSLGPYTDRNGLVFGFDTADGESSYKGIPSTNLITSGYPGFFGSGGEVISATSYKGKKSDSGIFLRNVVTSPNVGNNGGLYKTFSTATLNPTTRYIQISFDYYGIVPYQRSGSPSNGLNGYMGITFTDSTNDTYGWDVTHTGGSGDDWNNLQSRMGYWQKISLIVALNQSKNPSSINAMYIYNDFLIQGEGVFTNFIITEHPTYPQSPVEFTSGTRTVTQSLLDITNNKIIDVFRVSFNPLSNIIYDGTDDFLSLNTPILSAGQSVYTIEAVFKPYSTKTQVIWEQNSAGITQNQRACMILLSSGVGGFNGQSNDYHGVVPYSPNTYYHWVIVISKNDTNHPIKVYNNGALYSQGTPSNGGNNLNVGSHGSAIGYKLNSNDEFFHGEIPVVRIYNEALSATDVLRNYNNYKKRFNI